MEADKTIAACQPKRLHTIRKSFEYAGASGGWIDALVSLFPRGRVFDVLEKIMDNTTMQQNFLGQWCGIIIRQNNFACMALMILFAHQKRSICAGVCSVVDIRYISPNRWFIMLRRHLTNRQQPKSISQLRNNLVMICKNMSWSNWVKFRACWVDIYLHERILSGKPGYWGVVKAHFAFIGWVFGPSRLLPAPNLRVSKPRRF